MDQPKSEGIRLLSLDGGDVRALSQLIILDEFMRRVEYDRNSPCRILPCEYFQMMAGVGTGGIIVILLAVLRLSIEEATEEFLTIWKPVYAEDTLVDPSTRSTKLESLMQDLMERKGIPGNQKLCNDERELDGCKAFVCVVPESNLGTCQKFFNYGSTEGSLNPTVVQAVRATCAVPTLFTSVSIEATGRRVSYVTGGYNFNNPAWEAIKEACEQFERSHPVACVLSLGCGPRAPIRLPHNDEAMTLNLMTEVASDSERAALELGWRLGDSGVYYRLSMDREIDTSSEPLSDIIGDIFTGTRNYLERVTKTMDQCVAASERLGCRTLKDISGLSEPRSTSVHGLPPLSAFFVERPRLINKMAHCLFGTGSSNQRRMVLSGLGGIGKTQVTVSFLLQFLPRFRHVIFIDASSVRSIESALVAKVKSLGSKYNPTCTKEALEILAHPDDDITRDWVIIYDNVDGPNIRIAHYFPKCTFGNIIITTRNGDRGMLAPSAHVKLDVMSEKQAVSLLLQLAIEPPLLTTEDDENHARAIAEELGYLPVALVQAGYFINVHKCLPGYRQLVRKRRHETLDYEAEEQLDDHYHSIYATLNVTWPHLSDQAQRLMSILGFVDYTGFPIILIYRAAVNGFLFEPFSYMDRPALFQQTVELLCKTLRPREDWCEHDVDKVVVELERYSLVTRMTTHMVQTLRLHPLVHSWAHDRLSKDERERYQAAAVRLLACGTGSRDEDIYEFIYPHINLLAGQLSGVHVNDRAGFATVLTHQGKVKAAVEVWKSIRKEVRGLHDRTDIRSTEVDLQLARVYCDWQWEYSTESTDFAFSLEKEASEIRKQVLGAEHPMTIKAVIQYASHQLKRFEGNSEELVKTLKEAAELWERWSDNDWEARLQIKETLAFAVGPGSTCTDLRKEILNMKVERNGPDHYATLEAMHHLANTSEWCWVDGDWDVVGPDVCDIRIALVAAHTRRRGPSHSDTLEAIESLAGSYTRQGKHELSLEQWKKLVRLRKEVHGPLHSDTVSAMEGVAKEYDRLMRRAECEDQWNECLHLRKEAQGASHWETLITMTHMAFQFEEWERYTESAAHWKEIICLRKEMYGFDMERLHQSMGALASVYTKSEQYAESEAQWKELVRYSREVMMSPADTAIATIGLARMYAVSKQYTKSEAQWKEVLSLANGLEPIEAYHSRHAMVGLAELYEECERYEEVVGLLTQIPDWICRRDIDFADVPLTIERVRRKMDVKKAAVVSDARPPWPRSFRFDQTWLNVGLCSWFLSLAAGSGICLVGELVPPFMTLVAVASTRLGLQRKMDMDHPHWH